MLELGQLKSQIQGINSRTENTRREAVQALKAQEAADWPGVSNEIVRPLVETLRHQLPKSHETGAKPPLFRQEIATILPPREQYTVTTSEFDDVKARLAALENHRKVNEDKDSSKPTLRRKTADSKDTTNPDGKDKQDDDRPTLKRRDNN